MSSRCTSRPQACALIVLVMVAVAMFGCSDRTSPTDNVQSDGRSTVALAPSSVAAPSAWCGVVTTDQFRTLFGQAAVLPLPRGDAQHCRVANSRLGTDAIEFTNLSAARDSKTFEQLKNERTKLAPCGGVISDVPQVGEAAFLDARCLDAMKQVDLYVEAKGVTVQFSVHLAGGYSPSRAEVEATLISIAISAMAAR